MKLIYYPNKHLNTKCSDVVDFPSTHAILDEMITIMDKHKGLGLSSNQVGLELNMFIAKNDKNENIEFINPTILLEEGMVAMSEGCLSAPGVFLSIPRSNWVCVEAYNRDGRKFVEEASGLYARTILHELSHLKGEFYFDRVNRAARRAAISQLKKTLK